MSNYLKIELLHAAIARNQTQKDTLRGLGLRRRHQQRILKDTPAIRGMITKVFDLVRYEKTSDSKLTPKPKVETYRLGPVPPPQPPKEKKKSPVKAAEGFEAKKVSEGKSGAKSKPGKGKTKASKSSSPKKK